LILSRRATVSLARRTATVNSTGDPLISNNIEFFQFFVLVCTAFMNILIHSLVVLV
jgi:hypothetical protein